MPDPKSVTPYRLAARAEKGALIRLAMIGIAVLVVVASFAFVAGWLPTSPDPGADDRWL